jgi:hypothetical protein
VEKTASSACIAPSTPAARKKKRVKEKAKVTKWHYSVDNPVLLVFRKFEEKNHYGFRSVVVVRRMPSKKKARKRFYMVKMLFRGLVSTIGTTVWMQY